MNGSFNFLKFRGAFGRCALLFSGSKKKSLSCACVACYSGVCFNTSTGTSKRYLQHTVPAQVLCTFNAQLKKMMIRYDCWLLLFTKKIKNKSKILSYCTLQNA